MDNFVEVNLPVVFNIDEIKRNLEIQDGDSRDYIFNLILSQFKTMYDDIEAIKLAGNLTEKVCDSLLWYRV